MAGRDIELGILHGVRTGSGKGSEVTIAFEDTGAGTSSFSLPTAGWIKP